MTGNDIYRLSIYSRSKGYHLFTSLELIKNFNLGFGLLREEGLLKGGRNYVNYFKVTYFTETPKFGSLRIFYTLKQVKDNIPNDCYQFPGVITTADPFPDYVLDPLFYKNSLVNNLYIGTTYTQIPGLRIENNFRFQLNHQFPQGNRLLAFANEARLLNDQVEGRISFFGMVNKIEYEFSFLNNALKVIPQFKIRTEKSSKFTENKDGEKITIINKHLQETIPIVRVDYRLTQNTTLHFGMQGITFLKGITPLAYRIRNLKDDLKVKIEELLHSLSVINHNMQDIILLSTLAINIQQEISSVKKIDLKDAKNRHYTFQSILDSD